MRPSHRQTCGFTLIELIFSMAIGSIILILAAAVLSSSGDGYERVGGGVASEREARALITRLSSDLANARFHVDGVLEKQADSRPGVRLGFLSLQPAHAQTDAGRIGDLCAVNYYVKDLSIGGKTVRCLMRGFRESGETFDALRSGAVADLFVERVKLDDPLALGVGSFEARPKSRNAAGEWIDWQKSNVAGPEAFEVKLVVVRRELAGKLKSPGDWDGAAQVGRHKDLDVYVTFLPFGNHAN